MHRSWLPRLALSVSFGLGLLDSADAAPARVSLDVKDADVHNVFRLLAEVGRMNLVVSDAVKGRLSLKLTNVAWEEVLRIVLDAKGLGMQRRGDVLYVDTLERLASRAESELRLQRTRKELAPLRTVMIAVRHAKAKDLEPIVRGLLTERGTVEVDVRTNTLIVTDVHEDADRVRRVLR